jgi:flagellar motor protein MotB
MRRLKAVPLNSARPQNERSSSVNAKVRAPRISRSSDEGSVLVADDAGHLWAISYADFLMVLLSFFVIFFSMDKGKRSDLVLKIASQIGGAGAKGSGNAVASGVDEHGVAKMTPANLAALKTKVRLLFPESSAVVKAENDKIIVDFADDFYSLGSYELSGQSQEDLLKLLNTLKDYQAQIAIGFVGHTDKVPVRHEAERGLESNLDISVIRGSRALSLAVKNGFNSSHLYATGAGSQLRNSRSLSIVVKPYSGGLL